MSDLIFSIWMHFCVLPGPDMQTRNGHSMKYITDINQCVSMTNVALQHGCDVQSHHLDQGIPTPLFFNLAGLPRTKIDGASLSALQEHLLAAGYEMEEKNSIGQTPLLFAANTCKLRCLAVLNQLVSLGANIHATDNEGRGALHQALDLCRGLMASYLEIFMKGQLRQESHAMSEWIIDYYHNSDVPLVDSDNFTVYPSDIEWTHARHTDYHDDVYDDDADIDYSPDNDSEVWDPCGDGDDDRHAYIGGYDIDDFNISNGIEDIEVSLPSSKQKTRLRLKLLTLLGAGCDPNLVDKEGASPSDYARREDLWPQWEWALAQTGYIYDEDKQLWIKDVSFSDIVDFTAAE
jgi:hypothetical protein